MSAAGNSNSASVDGGSCGPLAIDYLRSLPPCHPQLVEAIVTQIKSQGLFDDIRKACLADVDTKPSYLNLKQRVKGYVNAFLERQHWSSAMQKNQLREALRKDINESGLLKSGLDHLVDQLVFSLVERFIRPKVEASIADYLGIVPIQRSLPNVSVPPPNFSVPPPNYVARPNIQNQVNLPSAHQPPPPPPPAPPPPPPPAIDLDAVIPPTGSCPANSTAASVGYNANSTTDCSSSRLPEPPSPHGSDYSVDMSDCSMVGRDEVVADLRDFQSQQQDEDHTEKGGTVVQDCDTRQQVQVDESSPSRVQSTNVQPRLTPSLHENADIVEEPAPHDSCLPPLLEGEEISNSPLSNSPLQDESSTDEDAAHESRWSTSVASPPPGATKRKSDTTVITAVQDFSAVGKAQQSGSSRLHIGGYSEMTEDRAGTKSISASDTGEMLHRCIVDCRGDNESEFEEVSEGGESALESMDTPVEDEPNTPSRLSDENDGSGGALEVLGAKRTDFRGIFPVGSISLKEACVKELSEDIGLSDQNIHRECAREVFADNTLDTQMVIDEGTVASSVVLSSGNGSPLRDVPKSSGLTAHDEFNKPAETSAIDRDLMELVSDSEDDALFDRDDENNDVRAIGNSASQCHDQSQNSPALSDDAYAGGATPTIDEPQQELDQYDYHENFKNRISSDTRSGCPASADTCENPAESGRPESTGYQKSPVLEDQSPSRPAVFEAVSGAVVDSRNSSESFNHWSKVQTNSVEHANLPIEEAVFSPHGNSSNELSNDADDQRPASVFPASPHETSMADPSSTGEGFVIETAHQEDSDLDSNDDLVLEEKSQTPVEDEPLLNSCRAETTHLPDSPTSSNQLSHSLDRVNTSFNRAQRRTTLYDILPSSLPLPLPSAEVIAAEIGSPERPTDNKTDISTSDLRVTKRNEVKSHPSYVSKSSVEKTYLSKNDVSAIECASSDEHDFKRSSKSCRSFEVTDQLRHEIPLVVEKASQIEVPSNFVCRRSTLDVSLSPENSGIVCDDQVFETETDAALKRSRLTSNTDLQNATGTNGTSSTASLQVNVRSVPRSHSTHSDRSSSDRRSSNVSDFTERHRSLLDLLDHQAKRSEGHCKRDDISYSSGTHDQVSSVGKITSSDYPVLDSNVKQVENPTSSDTSKKCSKQEKSAEVELSGGNRLRVDSKCVLSSDKRQEIVTSDDDVSFPLHLSENIDDGRCQNESSSDHGILAANCCTLKNNRTSNPGDSTDVDTDLLEKRIKRQQYTAQEEVEVRLVKPLKDLSESEKASCSVRDLVSNNRREKPDTMSNHSTKTNARESASHKVEDIQSNFRSDVSSIKASTEEVLNVNDVCKDNDNDNQGSSFLVVGGDAQEHSISGVKKRETSFMQSLMVDNDKKTSALSELPVKQSSRRKHIDKAKKNRNPQSPTLSLSPQRHERSHDSARSTKQGSTHSCDKRDRSKKCDDVGPKKSNRVESEKSSNKKYASSRYNAAEEESRHQSLNVDSKVSQCSFRTENKSKCDRGRFSHEPHSRDHKREKVNVNEAALGAAAAPLCVVRTPTTEANTLAVKNSSAKDHRFADASYDCINRTVCANEDISQKRSSDRGDGQTNSQSEKDAHMLIYERKECRDRPHHKRVTKQTESAANDTLLHKGTTVEKRKHPSSAKRTLHQKTLTVVDSTMRNIKSKRKSTAGLETMPDRVSPADSSAADREISTDRASAHSTPADISVRAPKTVLTSSQPQLNMPQKNESLQKFSNSPTHANPTDEDDDESNGLEIDLSVPSQSQRSGPVKKHQRKRKSPALMASSHGDDNETSTEPRSKRGRKPASLSTSQPSCVEDCSAHDIKNANLSIPKDATTVSLQNRKPAGRRKASGSSANSACLNEQQQRGSSKGEEMLLEEKVSGDGAPDPPVSSRGRQRKINPKYLGDGDVAAMFYRKKR